MDIVLYILGAVLYLAFGNWLGKKAIDVWAKGDSKRLASYLLFPTSAIEESVGQNSVPVNAVFDKNGLVKQRAYSVYRSLMLIGWPLRLFCTLYCFFICSIGLLLQKSTKPLEKFFKPPSDLRKQPSVTQKELAVLPDPIEQEIATATKNAIDELEHPELKYKNLS